MKLKRHSTGQDLVLVAEKAAKESGIESGVYKDSCITRAVWKFCEHFHEGQQTELYQMLSSMRMTGDVTLTEEEDAIYNAIVLEFTGCDVTAAIKWNNRMRAIYALKAARAYARAKSENFDESDINDLVTDLMHLKSMIYATEAGANSNAATRLAEDAFANFIAELEETTSTTELGTSELLTEPAGSQEELIEFLNKAGCDVKFHELEKPKWEE